MNDDERRRFQELRGRELRGESLPETEAAELARFYERLDAEEAALLAPARKAIEAETAALAEGNGRLRALLEREAHFTERLEVMQKELSRERQELLEERESVFLSLERAA